MKLYLPDDITIQTFDDSEERKANNTSLKTLAKIFPYSVNGSREHIEELQSKGAGIYITTNPQDDGFSRGIESTKRFQYLSLDLDIAKEKNHQTIEELEEAKLKLFDELKTLQLPPYGVMFTKNGLQPVWKFADPHELKSKEERIRANEEYQTMVKAITQVIGHKSEGDSISRVIRLPGSQHLKTPTDPYEITYKEISGQECTYEEFNKLYPPIISRSDGFSKNSFDWTKVTGTVEGEGRNDKLLRATRSVYARGIPEESILDMMVGLNQTFKPPLPDGEFKKVFEQAKKYSNQETSKVMIENKIPWPSALNEAAYHGVLGRLVKLVEPETEADPSAVLIGSLVAFGSIIGRGAYLEVGPVTHYLNLFNATVGHTAKARKGVASAEIRRFFTGIDTDWEEKCKKPSCSTGEGIIHHIRDRVVKLDDNGEEKTVDAGVDDKRLFIDGDELAATLQTMSRSGNTLSSILRLAYDGQDLSTLTKNNSEKASNPHIAISANITEIELKRLLTEVDLNNGLANRFLFTAARRARELPLGGNVPGFELDKLKLELANSVVFARTVGQITFDSQTQDAWIHIYHELTSEIPGLVGVLVARTEPHTLRVAAIYAAADRSNKIKIPHLRAACAVMDYTTETLFYLFGNSTGDPLAEKIIKVLNTKLAGMSRTDIFIFFGKNISSEQIGVSLEMLEKSGRIKSQIVETDGRPKTIFTLNTFNTSTFPKKRYLESLDEFVSKRGFNTDTHAQNNSEDINVKNVINVLSSNEGGEESGVSPEEEVKNPLNTLPGLEGYGKH